MKTFVPRCCECFSQSNQIPSFSNLVCHVLGPVLEEVSLQINRCWKFFHLLEEASILKNCRGGRQVNKTKCHRKAFVLLLRRWLPVLFSATPDSLALRSLFACHCVCIHTPHSQMWQPTHHDALSILHRPVPLTQNV